MGQVLTSCTSCCSDAQALEDVDSYQKLSDIGTNDNNIHCQGTLGQHMETASKTGALAFPGKKLDEFPEALQKVSGNLRNLDLSNNKITTIPKWIANFKSLKTLNLSGNQLNSLPEEIGQLSKLENLIVSKNCLSGALPKSLGKLKNLKELDASGNKLSKFPVSLAGLNHLNSLDLSSNKISAIPDGIEELQLTSLSLNQNQISSISPSLAQCPRLKTLKVEENCLSLDAIPTVLLTNSSVSTLNLNGNLFSEKQFAYCEGYEKYLERYTAVRRKMD